MRLCPSPTCECIEVNESRWLLPAPRLLWVWMVLATRARRERLLPLAVTDSAPGSGPEEGRGTGGWGVGGCVCAG
jgi:hypothetical protein